MLNLRSPLQILHSIRRTYFAPRIMGIGFFAIPYGMMYFLAVMNPQIWLKEIGISNTYIGLFALASLPYAFKFIWAPAVDLIKIPFLTNRMGHRRSWLLVIHLLLIASLLALGYSNPTQDDHMRTAVIAMVIAFLAATQDIIVDAYRIEILDKKETVPGISMLIFGYRMGSITARAGTLYLAHFFSWPLAYTVMALLVLIGVMATIFNPEPKRPAPNRTDLLYNTIVRPFQELLGRSRYWPTVAAFILLYRQADAMINIMASSFYLEIGFTKAEIATVNNVFGVVATIIGGFLGAAVVRKVKVYGGLFLCGVLHTVSNLMFVVMAIIGNSLPMLYSAIAVENITGGMSTAAFFVYLTRLCNLRFTATQFALFTSLWSLQTPLASFSGKMIDSLNGDWVVFFLITVLMSFPGLALIWIIRRYPLGNRGEIESTG